MVLFDNVAEEGRKKRVPSEARGLIGGFQDFVVHDGPGLRVLIFFEGCPLSCRWCQNPENMSASPEIMYRSLLCLECLRCLEVCPVPGAITEDKNRRIDRSKCTRCMRCVEVCTGRALSGVGEWISVEQLVERVLSYTPFFHNSDHGGVTLSGGDPVFQPKFALELLKLLRKSGIHTAFETCGYAKYEWLKKTAETADLVIYDIKHMNEASHIIGTGVSNKLILENLRRLCMEVNTEIVVHIPLISGFNDYDESIIATTAFVSSLKKIKHIDLLPFNEFPSGKYKALGLEWEYKDTKRQPEERLIELQDMVQSYGLEANIGGLW